MHFRHFFVFTRFYFLKFIPGPFPCPKGTFQLPCLVYPVLHLPRLSDWECFFTSTAFPVFCIIAFAWFFGSSPVSDQNVIKEAKRKRRKPDTGAFQSACRNWVVALMQAWGPFFRACVPWISEIVQAFCLNVQFIHFCVIKQRKSPLSLKRGDLFLRKQEQ